MDDFEDRSPAKLPTSFDCPACSANTPMGDGLRSGDAVRCSYCSLDYLVRVDKEGVMRLDEI